MVQRLVKSFQQAIGVVRKKPFRSTSVLILDIFSFTLGVLVLGLFLMGIQDNLLQAIEIIDMQPQEIMGSPSIDSISAIIQNSDVLDNLFSEMLNQVIWLTVSVFFILFIFQLLSYFILFKRSFKRKSFLHFSLISIIFYILFVLSFVLFTRLRFLLVSLPITLVSDNVFWSIFGILNVILFVFLLNSLSIMGEENYFKKWKKLHSKKDHFSLSLFYLLGILIIIMIFKYLALLNPFVFYPILLVIMTFVFQLYRLNLHYLSSNYQKILK